MKKLIIGALIAAGTIGVESLSEIDITANYVNEVQVESEEADYKKEIIQAVPFTPQAPLANWSDIRQAEGCEEASILTAMMWARDYTLTGQEAEKEIITISDFETTNYGDAIHTSIRDTTDRILKDYFKYEKYQIIEDFTKEDLIKKIYENKIIIIPTDGVILNNPHFKTPKPSEHMLVIIAYDPNTKEFITNDPGTKFGKNYRYEEIHLYNSIKNYNSSNKNEDLKEKAAIVIYR